MASTVPAKSQPLHNFPLSHLKWSSGHQRPRSSSTSAARLSSSSPHRSPTLNHGSPQHQSPLRQSLPPIHSPFRGGESTSASSPVHSPMRGGGGGGGGGCGEESALLVQVRQSPMRPDVSDDSTAPPSIQSPIRDIAAAGKPESSFKNGKPLIEYRRQLRNPGASSVKNGAFRSSSVDRDDSVEGKSDKKLKAAVESDNKESRSSKILIKIRPNTSKVAEEVLGEAELKVEDNEIQEEGKLLDAFDDEERLPKIWNLRPRKPIRKSLNLNGSGFKNSGSSMQEKRSQSPQVHPNGNNNRSETQKKDKRKIGFTLTLSREEIEEDIYALFGSKLSRRPKKRQKIAQKLLDNLFPGAWLPSVTADSYKVSEHPGKG